jgi:hypothetical protein
VAFLQGVSRKGVGKQAVQVEIRKEILFPKCSEPINNQIYAVGVLYRIIAAGEKILVPGREF